MDVWSNKSEALGLKNYVVAIEQQIWSDGTEE